MSKHISENTEAITRGVKSEIERPLNENRDIVVGIVLRLRSAGNSGRAEIGLNTLNRRPEHRGWRSLAGLPLVDHRLTCSADFQG